MNRVLVAILCCAPLVAVAADEWKVSQLEQDMRNLQRQVQAQSQQIDALRLQMARPEQIRPPVRPDVLPVAGAWIDAAKWQRVRNGMSGLEVIGQLGPPTSLRVSGGGRVLLYAIEIGSAGFLSGSVTLRERMVTSLETPVLK